MGKVAKTANRDKAGQGEQACPKCGKPVRIVKRIRNREMNLAGGMWLSCSACDFAERL